MLQGTVLERLFTMIPAQVKSIPMKKDIPFYRDQIRIALQNCGAIDPEDIRAYIARGGYQALPEPCHGQFGGDCRVGTSASAGRAAAAFQQRKWAIAAAQEGPEKYLIRNGDEGDPGAFMDRSIMEGDPQCDRGDGYCWIRHRSEPGIHLCAGGNIHLRCSGCKPCGLRTNVGAFWVEYSRFRLRFSDCDKAGSRCVCLRRRDSSDRLNRRSRGMPRPKPPFLGCGPVEKAHRDQQRGDSGHVPPALRQGAQWFRKVVLRRALGPKPLPLQATWPTLV